MTLRGTLRDDFRFAAPFGILGRIVETLVLRRYMTRLLERRNAVIKRVAESGGGASSCRPDVCLRTSNRARPTIA